MFKNYSKGTLTFGEFFLGPFFLVPFWATHTLSLTHIHRRASSLDASRSHPMSSFWRWCFFFSFSVSLAVSSTHTLTHTHTHTHTCTLTHTSSRVHGISCALMLSVCKTGGREREGGREGEREIPGERESLWGAVNSWTGPRASRGRLSGDAHSAPLFGKQSPHPTMLRSALKGKRSKDASFLKSLHFFEKLRHLGRLFPVAGMDAWWMLTCRYNHMLWHSLHFIILMNDSSRTSSGDALATYAFGSSTSLLGRIPTSNILRIGSLSTLLDSNNCR